MNDSPKVLKLKKTLYIDGLATIVLFCWSLIKSVLFFAMGNSATLSAEFEPIFEEEDGIYILIFVLVLVAIILGLDGLFRFYIGINAIKRSRSLPCKSLYIPLTFIITLISLYSVYTSITNFESSSTVLNGIASIAMDCIAIFIQLEIIVNSLRLKKYEA